MRLVAGKPRLTHMRFISSTAVTRTCLWRNVLWKTTDTNLVGRRNPSCIKQGTCNKALTPGILSRDAGFVTDCIFQILRTSTNIVAFAPVCSLSPGDGHALQPSACLSCERLQGFGYSARWSFQRKSLARPSVGESNKTCHARTHLDHQLHRPRLCRRCRWQV